VNDVDVRQDIRQARGFCQQHAWQLVEGGSSLGAVIIVRDVMKAVLKTLDSAALDAPKPSVFGRVLGSLDRRHVAPANADLIAVLAPQSTCPVCVFADHTENDLVDVMVASLTGEPALMDAFCASDGLCLLHLRQAMTRVRDEAIFEGLLNAQKTIWTRLVGQLDEIVRKEDYRFRHEPRGEEVGASLRAIAALSGPRIDTP